MQNQNKKITRWILGGALVYFLLEIVIMLIIKTIFENNPETCGTYATVITLVLMFIYIIFCVIGVVRYNKYATKYENAEVEKARKELTAEFKEVLLKYPVPIDEDLFKYQAKVDDDGKIVCKIQLDYEMKFESYEKFLRYFHFNQD